MDHDAPSHPLSPLVNAWVHLLSLADKDRARKFDNQAELAMMYFRANAREVWARRMIQGQQGIVRALPVGESISDGALAPPAFRIVLNKMSEIVRLFGPELYPRNPRRLVNPLVFDEPTTDAYGLHPDAPPEMLQAFEQQAVLPVRQRNMQRRTVARILDKLLNFSPNELNLRGHSRRVISEALITGLGIWLHEMDVRPDGTGLCGAFYESNKSILYDPDAEGTRDNALWIAIRRRQPWWMVEERFGLPPETMKRYANTESIAHESTTEARSDGAHARRKGETSDLVTYWEIYSRMGLGSKLASVDDSVRGIFEHVGRYAYIVVCRNCPFPLNAYDQRLLHADGRGWERFRWPVPWHDIGEWPITDLAFHEDPQNIWPISHIKPGLPLLEFLNWAFGFLMQHIRRSSLTVMGLSKILGDEIVEKLKSGEDWVVAAVERVSGFRSVTDMISFVQAPPVNQDIWSMIAAVMQEFDKSVLLSEILYGRSERQHRSATESEVKAAHARTGVEDMIEVVGAASSRLARKEAFMSRHLLQPRDVLRIVGPADAVLWGQHVQAVPSESIARDYEYRIEADVGPKPSRAVMLGHFESMFQMIGSTLVQRASMGDVEPLNNWISHWARLQGIPDPTPFLLPPPPPPPPPPPEAQQAANMEAARAQMQLQNEAAMAQLAQQREAAKLQAEAVKISAAQQKAQLEAEAAQQELLNRQERHELEMRQRAERGLLDAILRGPP
jgi:hypothetical protein